MLALAAFLVEPFIKPPPVFIAAILAPMYHKARTPDDDEATEEHHKSKNTEDKAEAKTHIPFHCPNSFRLMPIEGLPAG